VTVHHADVVGSLLAPPELAEVQSYTPAREVTPGELKQLQDRAIDDALAMQERASPISSVRPRCHGGGTSSQCSARKSSWSGSPACSATAGAKPPYAAIRSWKGSSSR